MGVGGTCVNLSPPPDMCRPVTTDTVRALHNLSRNKVWAWLSYPPGNILSSNVVKVYQINTAIQQYRMENNTRRVHFQFLVDNASYHSLLGNIMKSEVWTKWVWEGHV